MQSVTRSVKPEILQFSSKQKNPIEPEILQSSSKPKNPVKQGSVCSDKNCQDTMFMWPLQPAKKESCYMRSMPRPVNLKSEYKKKKSVYDDKNCQSTQGVHMHTAMQPSNMQLPKPATPSSCKKLCSYKNCQSTRFYKKKCPVRPVCTDKNCQSGKCMCYDKKQ